MMTRSLTILSVAAMLLTMAACSCFAPKRSLPDCQQYDFFAQEKLKAVFFDLLKIDYEQAMRDAEVSTERFNARLREYCTAQGLDLSASGSWSDAQQQKWKQLHDEFCTQNPSFHANVPGPLLIAWDSWGNYVDGETFFRDRLAPAAVMPEDALKAFRLSNRLRTAIGQYEIGLYEMSGADFRDYEIACYRALAQDVLNDFRPDPEATPLCCKLVDLARAEIAKSARAEKRGHWGSAFRWATDAEKTALSAKALYKLEMKGVEQHGRQISSEGARSAPPAEK